VSFSEIHVLPHTTADHSAIGEVGAMSRDVGDIADDDDGLINPTLGWSRRECETEGDELGFGGHGGEDFSAMLTSFRFRLNPKTHASSNRCRFFQK
jgi:hypothetical protein